MIPVVGFVARWLIGGFIASVGWELGKAAFNVINEDGWVTKGFEETRADVEKTWKGRYGTDTKEDTCCGGSGPNCCTP